MTSPNQHRTLGGTTWRVGIATFLWLLLGAAMLLVVPRVFREFNEFGMTLPASTQFVIDISMWVAEYWWIAFPFVAPVVVVAALITYLVRHRSDNRLLTAAWTLFLFLPPVLCHVVFWLSLLLPWMKLMEGLKKS